MIPVWKTWIKCITWIHVSGEANDAIRNLVVTNNNFPIAWDLLVNQFENNHRLIIVHLWLLFDLLSHLLLTAPISNGLRAFRNQVNGAIQALRNLNRAVEWCAYWNDVLVFLVTEKLDTKTWLAWKLKFGNIKEYPHYSELDQFLESRMNSFDSIVPASSKEMSKPTSKRKALASYIASTIPLTYTLCKTNHYNVLHS